MSGRVPEPPEVLEKALERFKPATLELDRAWSGTAVPGSQR